MAVIKEEEIQNVVKNTDEILKKYGPRLAGETATLHAAEDLYQHFETNFDSARKERFEFHPRAFLGWIRIIVFFYLVGSIGFWLKLPIIAGILILIGIATLLLELIFYVEFVDPLWKKKEGMNVIGEINPANEVKQQIILSGHHDSAFIFHLVSYQPLLYLITMYGAVGFILLQFLLSWFWILFDLFSRSFLSPGIILSFQVLISIGNLFVLQMWFFKSRSKGTLGAGDNLVSSMIAYQIGLKLMEAKKNGNPLQNTRIIIASWDGEESGLRGARAFCKAHSKELHQIPTQVFNMDCLYNIDNLFFLSSDINQTVKLSADLALKCSNIAKKIGYNTTIRPIPLLTGGTDAGEFGKIGVEATTLLAIAMPWDKESRNAVYHTLKDDITALDPQAIQAALEIIWKLIHQEDKL